MSTDISLADYTAQAAALDFVVAYQKSSTGTKASFGIKVAERIIWAHNTGYDAIAWAAYAVYGITISADVLRRYIYLMKTPTPNKAIGAFMKRVQSDANLRKQFFASATSYDALEKVATANGLAVSALDLQNYLTPWLVFASLLDGLLGRKVITAQQYEEHTGFAPDDGSISGFGHDVDVSLIKAALSASSWASRLSPLSDLSAPIATLIFPTAAVVVGGYEGQTFSFSQLGNMFEQSFSDALEGTAQQLEDFHDNLSSIF